MSTTIRDFMASRSWLLSYIRFVFGMLPTKPMVPPQFEGVHYQGRNFLAYYREHIFPELQPCEALRQKQLRALRLRSILAAFAFIGILFIARFLSPNQPLLHAGFIVLIATTMLVVWAVQPVYQFRLNIKHRVFPKILQFFGSDFRYYVEQDPSLRNNFQQLRKGFQNYAALFTSGKYNAYETSAAEAIHLFRKSQQDAAQIKSDRISPVQLRDFEPSGLLRSYDKALVEDIVVGSHEGVAIAFMEVRLYARSGDDRRSEQLIEHALYVRLSMNKAFAGHTLLRTDRGILNWTQANRGLEKIALEDPRFERMFEVYGSNQIEARYLLTPSMMERLQHLGALFDQPKGIEAAFYDQHLLLRIPMTREDWFEGGDVFSPVTFEADVQMLFAQMRIIFDLIALLRLQEQTRL